MENNTKMNTIVTAILKHKSSAYERAQITK